MSDWRNAFRLLGQRLFVLGFTVTSHDIKKELEEIADMSDEEIEEELKTRQRAGWY